MIPYVEPPSRKRDSTATEAQQNNIKRMRFEASTPRQRTGPFSPTPFTSDPFAPAPQSSDRGFPNHRSNPSRTTGQVIPHGNRGRPNLVDYPYTHKSGRLSLHTQVWSTVLTHTKVVIHHFVCRSLIEFPFSYIKNIILIENGSVKEGSGPEILRPSLLGNNSLARQRY